MTSAQICIILAIAAYLIAMVGVGVYFSRSGGESSSDFFLGGRRLGPVVTAMSAEASDMSSYLLMGLPGLAYLCGVAEVGWTVIGLAAGTYLNWLIVAKRLRRYSAVTGAITIPDFFSRRYGDQRHILACIAAAVILIFFGGNSLQQPPGCRLPCRYDCWRVGYYWLYGAGRLPGSLYHGLDSERRHVHRPFGHHRLRRSGGGRMGRGGGERFRASGVSEPYPRL